MADLSDVTEKFKTAGANILAAIIFIPWMLGAPVTFIYLIMEDAAYYHSFFGWAGAIVADSFAAGIWPFYWLGRLIFGG